MSSIPSSKMKHAHAHEGDHPEQTHPHAHQAEAQGAEAQGAEAQGSSQAVPGAQSASAPADLAPTPTPAKSAGSKLSNRAQRLVGRAEDLAEEAVGAVKARPKAAAVIGAAILAGAAAFVGGPAAARALRGDEADEPETKRKRAGKRS